MRKLIKKIKKIIRKPKIILMYILARINLKFIPDESFLKLSYWTHMNKRLNLSSPETFNEKIQWLKLNDRKEIYTTLVDKYAVRKYIEKKIGGQYLIQLFGAYDSFEEIDFEVLPNSFVMKPNHTSGDIFICKNKNEIDYKKLKKIVQKWLERDYYWVHREWPYKNIKKKIIIEKYIENLSSNGLIDYKLMCFNGKVKCSFLCLNRNSSEGLNVDFYDLKWNKMPFERHYPKSNQTISKPINYEKMIEYAEILSEGIPFIRVDFYETDEKLFFGELTLYPGAGIEEFTPEKYDYELGSWIEIELNNK